MELRLWEGGIPEGGSFGHGKVGTGRSKAIHRIVYLSDAGCWDSPHDTESLTISEREDHRRCFEECYEARKERVLFW